jgi:hypothetical protein
MMQTEVYWKLIRAIGLEHLILQEDETGVVADGFMLLREGGIGLRLSYRLRCDSRWRPRELWLRSLGQDATGLRLSADGSGTWFDGEDRPLDFLRGCIDIDLMATPFTNTIPIKRLEFAVGESHEIEVAYITVPELRVQRAGQRYTCLVKDADKSCYLYESLDSDFKAELWVDSQQLVTTYEGIWERVI